MNYTTCSQCGQNALPVATRCPRCGNPFEEQFMGRAVSTPKRRRAPLALLVVGAVVALLLANALMRKLETPARDSGMTAAPAAVHKPAPKSGPPSQAPAAIAERRPTPAAPEPTPTSLARAQAPSPSPPPRPESVAPRPAMPAAPTAAIAVPGAPRRYASTWINVRAARLNTAPVLRVLHPGEAVQVDSLAQGWYRVYSNQAAPGYVDRRLLDTLPPAASP